MEKITLYTSPTCVKCKILKNRLEENNISFEQINIVEDFKAKALLLSKGLMTLPVVEYNNELIIDETIIEEKLFND